VPDIGRLGRLTRHKVMKAGELAKKKHCFTSSILLALTYIKGINVLAVYIFCVKEGLQIMGSQIDPLIPVDCMRYASFIQQ
jgi:uncharacterized membrane protein YqgA involved in biofilm formation